jgi:hypothetical protein
VQSASGNTENQDKARAKAVSLYPQERWIALEPRIFIAESRKPRSNNQKQVLEKERIQARILTAQGSTVYLLPEIADPVHDGVKHPDAVVDGFVMEFKTITGGIRQVEHHFKKARQQADTIFFKIDTLLEVSEVKRKLALVSNAKNYTRGAVIVHFTEHAKTHYWAMADLLSEA